MDAKISQFKIEIWCVFWAVLFLDLFTKTSDLINICDLEDGALNKSAKNQLQADDVKGTISL